MPHHRAVARPLLSFAVFIVLLPPQAGCRQDAPPSTPPAKALDYTQELPPGEKALRKIQAGQYPDFAVMQTNPADLAASIDHSLAYLSRPSSRQFFPYLDITHDRAVATLRAMRQALARGPVDWNAEVRARFEVYQSVGAPAPESSGGYTGQVLFTGYFTPIYNASLTRGGPYQWPLYRKPKDLVVVNEAADVVGRGQPGSPDALVATPYYPRVQIERDGVLAGQELVWLTSRWEAYVVTVQGSARLRLPDNRQIEVGYAATNGHPYVSPGRLMVKDGVVPRDQLSFTGLRRYFDAHPGQMDKYLWANPRTTFFTDTTGQGIRGSLNVPVTAFATIATDKDIYPRAMPAYVATRVPRAVVAAGGEPFEPVPYGGFMLDQDTGGAIRAAGRGDLYMGVGDAAERVAGHQLHPGKLYYLALKPELVPQYAPATGAAGGR